MTRDLNFKPLFFDKLEEFSGRFRDYSVAELLYSIFTEVSKSKKGNGLTKNSDILSISDEQFYTAIDKAIKNEKEEK